MSDFYEFSAVRLLPVPVSVVWQITANPRRNADWCNNVRRVIRIDGNDDSGQSFEEQSTVVGPWTTTTTWTLLTSEFERQRTFTGRGFPGVGEIRPFIGMEPMLDASRVEHTCVTYGSRLELSYGRLNVVAARLLRSMLSSEFAISLANLEALAVDHAARSGNTCK